MHQILYNLMTININKIYAMGTQLSYFDRQQIEHYLRLDWHIRRIAKRIAKDHSVVSREINRNKSPHLPYKAKEAQYFAERRSRITNKAKLEKDESLRDYVVENLKADWSPEQISGRLKEFPPKGMEGKYISYESIYKYIYDKEPYLYHKLRRAHPDRWKKFGRKKQKHEIIPEKVSIHDRPKVIDERSEFGHLESDSMIGKNHKKGLSVQFERVSKYTIIQPIENFTSQETKDAIITTLADLPDNFVKSITFDNGSENTKHTEIRDEYSIDTFFCDPYCAWQKGGVENSIGLVRQYLPKRTDLTKVPLRRLYQIEYKLNTRPRKSLNFKTPKEVLKEYIKQREMVH